MHFFRNLGRARRRLIKRPKLMLIMGLQNLGLLLGTIIVLFVMLNLIYVLFFRIEHIPPDDVKPYRRQSHIAGIHVEHIPGARKVSSGVEVSINSYGFRDYEFEVEKPRGMYRIIAVGDSWTFGEGVRLEDTYPKKLEKKLNQYSLHRKLFEVLNTGVQGYNTVEEAVLLRHRILPLKPDLIIVGFTEANDPEIISFEPFILEKTLGRTCFLLKVPFLRYLGELFARMVNSFRYTDYIRQIYQPDGWPWHACKRALKEIRDTCKEHHIRVVVALFPILIHTEEYRPQREQLKMALRDLEMPFVEMFPFLQDIPLKRMCAPDTYGHPSPVVYERFSEVLYQYIKDMGILEETESRQTDDWDSDQGD